jgi:hypothetical protein
MQRKSWLLGGLAALVVACGGGKPVAIEEEAPGGVIIVRASAGSPLEGVKATVYAIDPVTGEPIEGRSGGAVLAEAKGSSADGTLTLELGEDVRWSGPIQVVISGADIHYVDPTGAEGETLVFLPDAFQLSSYVSEYRTGSTVTVPVTLWTTLADAAAKAYAAGRTSGSASPAPIERALPVIDELFSQHLSGPLSWNLRATLPVNVRANVGSVRDVIFAALADVALNQLARDISVTAGHTPGAVVTAYQLLELLQADISDGVFNGLEGEKQLAARGGVYELTSRTTRFDLARALGAFVDAPANVTGLTRQALESNSVFDNIALDRNFLYPADEDPKAFDAVPPEVELLEALPEYCSKRTITARVRAKDSGTTVSHVRAQIQNGVFEKTFEAERTEDHWVVNLELLGGANEVQIWAEDEAVPANTGKGWSPPHSIVATVIFDDTPPGISTAPSPSHINEDGAPLLVFEGRPTVPGKLDLSKKSIVDLNENQWADIKKTYVTSSWQETPPTGEELENGNPRNIPFRQFSVAVSDDKHVAPLTAVTWQFQASDGTTVSTSEGEAIPGSKTPTGKRLFHVVFTQETIPLLKTTTAPSVNLELSVFTKDAAGNSAGTDPLKHTYVLIDTPLHYTVDTTYPSKGSPKSIYGYLVNSTLYEHLFDPSEDIATAKAARVGRIEVLNPWPVPVAVQQAGAAVFSFSEEWENRLTPISGATIFIDDIELNTTETWPAGARPRNEQSCLWAYAGPCGVGNWRESHHVRYDNGSFAGLTCGLGREPNPAAFSTSRAELTHADARYLLAEVSDDGDPEEKAARINETGPAIVPAASDSMPGQVLIFPGINATKLQRKWDAGWNTVTHQWERHAGVFYEPQPGSKSCDSPVGSERGLVTFKANHWDQALLSARSIVPVGTELKFRVRPLYINGQTIMEAGPVPAEAVVPFSVDFSHGRLPSRR